MPWRAWRTALVAVVVLALVVSCSSAHEAHVAAGVRPVRNVAPTRPQAPQIQPIRHVFVINLENKGFEQTFGGSAAPYLANVLRRQGELFENYYSIGHNSLPNYIAQISGQAPDADTQNDCPDYSNFVQRGWAPDGQARGSGCIYPRTVRTVADQLDAAGLTWRAYYEDMDTSPSEPRTCRHARVGAHDDPIPSGARDLYTTRIDPFVYFHSIIDTPRCRERVVALSFLNADLASPSTSPNLAYVTPNLCHNGHNATCGKGVLGGLVAMDRWLQEWVPRITESTAFRHGGLLAIVFDEANFDDTACCNELPGPNVALPGIDGPGGGRVAALLIGTGIAPGSTNLTAYDHYSLLCSIENIFHLSHLGMAGAPGLPCFGHDVFNAPT